MTKPSKRVPRWQAAFLRALSRCGNVRMAAEAAGIDKTVTYSRRKADPRFAVAWDRAKVRAAARLSAGLVSDLRDAARGVPGTAVADARPLVIHAGHSFLPPRLQRSRARGWNAERERAFLQRLADTGNVAEAARSIGMTCPSIYKRRAQDSVFRKAWDAALAAGIAALEEQLIEATVASLDPDIPLPAGLPLVDVASAIHMVDMYRRREGGMMRRRVTPPSLDDPAIRASIIRKLVATEREAAREQARQRRRDAQSC
ncbi:MAG: hypothetical protein V4530_16240 [Pseudomonadota bacterium]